MKKLSLVGLILLMGGLIIFFTAFAFTGFNISKVSTTPEYEEKSYVSKTEITSVRIEENNGEIHFDKSPDDKVHVTYYQNDKEYYKITDNGKLEFKKVSDKQWFEMVFRLNLRTPEITVLVPDNFKGNINIETSNGKIDAKNLNADNFKASTFNGVIEMSDISASGDIEIGTSNGKIELLDVSAQKKITAETSNGKVSVDNISANDEIRLNTSNGAIKGSIKGKMPDYSITSHTTLGNNNLPERTNSGSKKFIAETTNGSIDIEFTED